MAITGEFATENEGLCTLIHSLIHSFIVLCMLIHSFIGVCGFIHPFIGLYALIH